VLQERTLRELGTLDVRARLDEVGFVESFYSFGVAHPGAITLLGFSDTAFRVFILMASRRLKSDRFFTRDYNACERGERR